MLAGAVFSSLTCALLRLACLTQRSVQVGNTLSVSAWDAEELLLGLVRRLVEAGILFVVKISVDNKDHKSPGSITGQDVHYYTLQVSQIDVVVHLFCLYRYYCCLPTAPNT